MIIKHLFFHINKLYNYFKKTTLFVVTFVVYTLYTNAQIVNWKFNLPIKVYENSGNSVANQQVQIIFNSQTLISQGKLNSDASDLRFSSDNQGITLLDFWLESGENTTTTKVWVKVPSIAANDSNTIYMFYGNSAAISVSSASKTFFRIVDSLQYGASLNEGTGTIINDLSGNNNNGISINTPIWNKGNCNGNSLYFDGNDDYITVPDDSTLNFGTGNFTVMAWVQGANISANGDNALVDKYVGDSDDGWMLKERNGNVALLTVEGGAWEQSFGSIDISDGAWHHVAAVRTSTGDKKIYVDSVLDLNYNAAVHNVSSIRELEIGRTQSYGYYVDGIIDEVYIFNKVLTSTEIQEVYSNYIYATPAYPNSALIYQCTSPAPTYTIGAENKLTAIQIKDEIICAGDSVQLITSIDTLSALSPPYSYFWSPTTGLYCDTCQSPIANPSSTTIYKILVTDSTGVKDSTFVTVTVLSNILVADAGLDIEFCKNDSIQLNATGGVNYLWEPSLGLTDTTIFNPYASPSVTTNYEVTVSNGCGSDIDTVTVFVNPLPQADAGVDTSVCIGESIQINATGGIFYLWWPGSGLSDSTVANPNANPLIPTTYSVEVTDSNGCVNTDSVTVSVLGVSLSSTYSFSPDPKLGTGTFNSCGTSNTGDYIDWVEISSVNKNTIHVRIQWYPSSSGSYTTTNGIHLKALHYDGITWTDIYSNLMVPNDFVVDTFQMDEFDFIIPNGSLSSTHYIRAMLIDRSDTTDDKFKPGIICADGSAGTGAGVSDRHYDNDDVNFEIINNAFMATADKDTICLGESVQLRVWGTDSSFTHIWTPGMGLSDSTISNPLAIPLTTTRYIVEVSIGNCLSYDTVTIFVDTVSFISASPDTSICIGDSVQLTASGSGVYLWYPATGLSCTDCQSPYASPSVTTTYYVTTPLVCSPIDSVTVSVGGGAIFASSARDTICSGDTTRLFAYSCAPSVFYDGFESGNISSWTDDGGAYSKTVTTTNPASGSYALHFAGGTSGHQDGISHSFTSSTPEELSFKVKTSSLSSSGCYVSIGQDPVSYWSSNSLLWFQMWNGNISSGVSTNLFTYSSNVWYFIELKNINWTAKTYDFYIDGVLLAVDEPFDDPSITNLDKIYLYTWTSSNDTYFDDILIGTPCSTIDSTLSFTWTPTTGLSNPNSPSTVASPSSTTSYIVTASSSGCSTTDTVTIYTSDLDVKTGTNTSFICSGDTTQLNATANMASVTFSWIPSTGLSCTNCSDPIASPSSTTMYYVTGISGTCNDVDSTLITVSTGLVSPSCTPITTNYCCGYGIYSVTFNTINSTTLDGIDSYQDYSCTNITDAIAEQSYTISIQTGGNDEENVRVWIDYNNNGVFANDTTMELVFWSDNILTNHSGIITIPASVVLNTPLRMRIGSDVYWNSPPAPCTNVTRGQFEDYTVIILPNTIPPVADFKTTYLDICQGMMQFIDSSTNNPTSWSWNFGDSIGKSTLQNPYYTFSKPGTFNVTLEVTNAYGSDILTKTVYVNSVKAAYSATTWAEVNTPVSFINQSLNATFYFWEFGNGYNSSLVSPLHIFTDIGTYKITLTSSNTICNAQESKYIKIVPTGIDNINNSSVTFEVYPNPSNESINILFDNNKHENDISINIYNILGEEVLNDKKIIHNKLVTNYVLKYFKKGIYYIKLFDGENIYVKKIILQ